jgi:hypothetical protein
VRGFADFYQRFFGETPSQKTLDTGLTSIRVARRLNFGALDRKAITEADLVVTTAEGPAVIADHAFATGHIPRATFERVLSPTRMKVGIDNGLGCFPDKMPPNRVRSIGLQTSSTMRLRHASTSRDAGWSSRPPAGTAGW